MPSSYAPPRTTTDLDLDLAFEHTKATPFWLDGFDFELHPALHGDDRADLVVVGGGYAGLWTALLAKEADPLRDVVLLEGHQVGWAASGRNGGFCEASLTHGVENGRQHFGSDLEFLDRRGRQNLDEIGATIARYGIDAEWERTGSLEVATEEYQLDWLRESVEDGDVFYEGAELRTMIRSPLYRAGAHRVETTALVHPYKLVRGLLDVCLQLGVRVHESSPVQSIRSEGTNVQVRTASGVVSASRVAVATNAFPSLTREERRRTMPIYDYALVTEPLSEQQLNEIGWTSRFGVADLARQFHYLRLTADNRMLFGGWDAVYHRGGRVDPKHDQRPETFRTLLDHLYRTFPPLRGVRVSHAWGGAIDMSATLAMHASTSHGGKVASVNGFTGLGVGASRFGAQVLLDLLSGEKTELTTLAMAQKRPIRMPPEPIAYPVVTMIRRAVERADERDGRDGLLLKAMGLVGISFDT